MKLKSILILLLVFVTYSVTAQQRHGKGFDVIERVKKEKAEFLKKELNLTDAEEKAFLPLEAEFTLRKYEINRDARRETRMLKKKENKTDADYERITELNLQLEKKESEIQIEYYKKFTKVLCAKKIEKYRIADLKFKERILQEHRRNQHK